MRILLVLALFFALPIKAADIVDFNESSSTIKTTQIEKVEDKVEAQLKAQEIELIKLRENLSIIREYNDDFLSIVLWSLGLLLTLTIVLLGFNWFQNSRVFKRELDTIKTELRSALELSEQELKSEVHAEIENLEQLLDKKAKSVATDVKEPLEDKIRWIKFQILEIQYDSLEAEVKKWLEKGVIGNAVITCADLIERGVELEWEMRLSRAIDLMGDIFHQIEVKGAKECRVDAQDVVEIETKLRKVPDSHKTLRDSLLKRLREFH